MLNISVEALQKKILKGLIAVMIGIMIQLLALLS